MMDFMMIWDADGVADLRRNEERVRSDVQRLLPVTSRAYKAWFSRDGQLAVLVWGRDVSPMRFADRYERDDAGLRFFCGWLVDLEKSTPIRSVADAHLESLPKLDGEFTACVAHPEGDIRIWRNLAASMPLYYSSDSKRFVLASRASVAAYGRRLSTRFELSRDFARSVLSASVPLNDASLFAGVKSLRQAATVYRPVGGRPVVVDGAADFLRDDGLVEQYRMDREGFWDDAFERLRSLSSVFSAIDAPIEVPLSGGKDSRLMLALLLDSGERDRIRNLLTWGVKGSPDLRSAQGVAAVLGLESIHKLRLSDASTAVKVDVDDRRLTSLYARHVFLTEGEMSPMDLTASMPHGGASVSGQEGGLRNIAGKRYFATQGDLLHWFKVHLGDWDVCRILSDDARAASEQEFLEYYGRQVGILGDFNQLPTKHRIEFRFRRWVARTWHINNADSFAPYLFPTDVVLRYTYNSGARSRSLEEFHYEMIRRADRRLLEVPFAEQTWDPELSQVTGHPPPTPKPFVWAEGTRPLARRPVGGRLQGRLDEIKALVDRRDPHVLAGVIDPGRLRAFDAGSMKPGHIQPLMHLLTFLLADAVSDFAELDTVAPRIGSLELPNLDAAPGDLGAVM